MKRTLEDCVSELLILRSFHFLIVLFHWHMILDSDAELPGWGSSQMGRHFSH